MALDSKHPQFQEFFPDWQQMRDTYEGERIIKDKGFIYLPPTSSMVADGALSFSSFGDRLPGTTGFDIRAAQGNKGWAAYCAYRMRARFPGWVREAVNALLGVMHRKPAAIELPPELEPMREFCTPRGESLQMLLRRVNEQQLAVGRLGLLGDVIGKGEREGQPYLSLYFAEHAFNWDEGERTETDLETLSLVFLDESAWFRQPSYEWEWKQRTRVLLLDGATYRTGVFDAAGQLNEADLVEPAIRGQVAGEIPFVFINAMDVTAEPDRPPLLPLSNLSLAHYRGQADYRQALYATGQDTLVVTGSSAEDGEDIRVGAGARIDLPIGGDAKYIGVDSAGLPEQRTAIENDQREATQMAGQLLDQSSRGQESGDALRIRVAARTSTLNQVALAGAFGLEMALRKIARWAGANPEAVKVTPNLDFVDDTITGQELGQIMGAKTMGLPLSLRSVHKVMVDRGMTEMTFEDELDEIDSERDLELAASPGTSNPNGPENDPQQQQNDQQQQQQGGNAA